MSADNFVFSTLIANHPDPATASRALAMAEAAVLRRAADALNALPQDYECDPGWGDAAERLRRTADGIEEKTGSGAEQYREVWDSTLPPGGRVCSICGQPVESEPCPQHGSFFETDHTYQREHHGAPITFQVTAISTSPDGRITVAHGWRTDPYSEWDPFDSDDFTGWTDVTEAGAGETSSPTSTDATPIRDAARERRLAQLLDTIRTHGGKWTTGTLQAVRRATGEPTQKGTARRDLAELHRRGHLAQHSAGDGRYYTLRRKDGHS